MGKYMNKIDGRPNGKRAPEILLSWRRDGFIHQLVRAHATNEWRAEKHKLGAKNFEPYFWTKTPRQLQAFKEENGL